MKIVITQISFSARTAFIYDGLASTFSSANIRSTKFFGSLPSFVFFGGDLKTFTNINGGTTLSFAAGFLMKMSLTQNVPYGSETCNSYTLKFGTTNYYSKYSIKVKEKINIGEAYFYS